MSFLVLGKDPVPLPSFQDIQFAPAPHGYDLEKILKPGKTLRQYDWIAHAPFVLLGDIDVQSPEYNKISPVARQSVPSTYSHNSWPIQPHVCASLAYEDAYMLSQVQAVLYVPNPDVVLSFRHLNPATKCTSAVTRFELEVVAEAVATAYNCVY